MSPVLHLQINTTDTILPFFVFRNVMRSKNMTNILMHGSQFFRSLS